MPMPMLAKPLTDRTLFKPGLFVAEEKYDGHRMMVRYGGHIFDGELLVPGGKHADVAILENLSKLVYNVFDVFSSPAGSPATLASWSRTGKDSNRKINTELMHVLLKELPVGECPVRTNDSYDARRSYLESLFENIVQPRLRIAEARRVDSLEQVMLYAHEVWRRSGEGLIVKQRNAHYYPGKRSEAFLKVKLWQSAVFTICGWEATKGEILNRGQYAVTCVLDGDGNRMTLKTLDDEQCERFAEHGRLTGAGPEHPDFGRELRCDYTARTVTDLYENIKWDRFEDE